jgi:hypothetical protein
MLIVYSRTPASPLVTNDPERIRNYFPTVKLVTP